MHTNWNRVAECEQRIAELEAERLKLICDAGAIAYRVCIEAGHSDLGQKCEAAIDAALMPNDL